MSDFKPRRDLVGIRQADERWMRDHPEVEEHYRSASLAEQVVVFETKGIAVTHARVFRSHYYDPKTGRDHQSFLRDYF